MSKKEKAAKITRILTTPPIFAFALCACVFLLSEDGIVFPSNFISDVFFLTLLPLAAYPVAFLIELKRKKQREATLFGFQPNDEDVEQVTLRNTERDLELVFSVIGYACGLGLSFLCGSAFEKTLFATYLSSAVVIAAFTLTGFKISGHACGCSGPIAAAALFINPWFLLFYVLLVPIFRSSLLLKRHTFLQLLLGAFVPVAFLTLFFFIFI